MKTTHRILITILLIALVLAACQGGGVKPVTGTTTPGAKGTGTPAGTPVISATPMPTVEAARLKGTQITFWYPWVGNTDKAVSDLVNQFNQQNQWGIFVQLQGFGGEELMVQAVDGAVEGEGSLPNVVAAPGYDLLAWQQTGATLADLSGYVSQAQNGFSSTEIADFYPVFWDQDVSANGFRYGLPAYRTAVVLFYNTPWAQSLGFDKTPITPDDFKDQVCAAVKDNMKTSRDQGGWIINNTDLTNTDTVNTDTMVDWSWLTAFGDARLPTDANTPPSFSAQEANAAFTWLRQLETAKCAWFPKNMQPYDYFAQRLGLIYAGTMEDLIKQADADYRLKSADAWSLAPFPSQNGKPFILTFGSSYGIFSSDPVKDMAGWLFMRWMVSASSQATMEKASSSLPLNRSALNALVDYGNAHPNWKLATGWMDDALALPNRADWRFIAPVLQDSFWWNYQAPDYISTPRVPDVTTLLKQLDDTLQNVFTQASATPVPPTPTFVAITPSPVK